MRTVVVVVAALAVLGIAGTHALTASASPNAKECPAGVVLSASASGSTVTVSLSPSVNLKPAADADPDSFHLHYFVDTDPATALQPGQAVPTGNAQIIHSAAATQDFKDLSAGSHRIWVVLGDVGHVPCSPLVVDDVTVTVAAAPSVAPATGTGNAPTSGGAAFLTWLSLAGGALAAGTGLLLRRRARQVR